LCVLSGEENKVKIFEETTFKNFSVNIVTLCSYFTYQSSTTEKNHKDNESLKPVVFDNLEAGFSKVPPLLSSPFFCTYLTALESSYTAFKTAYVLKGVGRGRDFVELH